MKIIIAGSRNYSPSHKQIEDNLEKICSKSCISEIVHGGCKTGADAVAHEWATLHDIPARVFPADWEEYGRAAGPIRNGEMAKYADALLAFWDGKSRGTYSMITEMRKLDKNKVIVLMGDSYEKELQRNTQNNLR